MRIKERWFKRKISWRVFL